MLVLGASVILIRRRRGAPKVVPLDGSLKLPAFMVDGRRREDAEQVPGDGDEGDLLSNRPPHGVTGCLLISTRSLANPPRERGIFGEREAHPA